VNTAGNNIANEAWEYESATNSWTQVASIPTARAFPAGGVIGGYPERLSDGSSIILSVQGWFTGEGRDMEGSGIRPDVIVARSIRDLHEAKDPQLDKGVEMLLLQLEGRVRPPVPR